MILPPIITRNIPNNINKAIKKAINNSVPDLGEEVYSLYSGTLSIVFFTDCCIGLVSFLEFWYSMAMGSSYFP